MKKINFKTLLLAIGLVVASTQPAWAGTKRIYCKMEQSWWTTDGAAVGVHYWSGSSSTTWPGERMKSEGNNIWSYNIPDNSSGIIFTRVNGSGDIADWGAKTKNLAFDGTNNFYTITSSSAVWGDPGCDGEWSKYAPNGAMLGDWNEWNPATDQFSNGSVTIHLEAGEHEFKVLEVNDYYSMSNSTMSRNNCTNWNLYTNNGNTKINADVTGDYKFTWNKTNHQLSITYPAVYTVTYNKNGATSGTVPTDATNYVSGSTVTVKTNSGSLAKTGYTFSGWNTKTDGTGDTYAAGSGTFTITANTTLYAEWTANQYTVTLDAKGGTSGTTSVTATYDAAMPSATMPTKTGYTFDGYYDADGSTSGDWGTQYYTSAGASAHVWDKASTATLYAKWTEKTWTVSANYGSGGASTTVTTSPAGQITGTTISAVAATGYNFSKWEVTSGGGSFGDQTSANTTFYPTANSTINATFELADVYYDFTFGLCDGMTGLGTVTSDKTAGSYISGTSITLTATPAIGYEVEGWYSAASGGIKIAGNTNPYAISLSEANKSIYVKFKKSTYDITYTPAMAPTGCAYTTVPSSAEFESNVTIVVTPTAGYTVTVKKDEETLTPNADGKTYTFTMPAKDVAISVSASENMTTVTVNANETTLGTVSGAVSSWGSNTSVGVITTANLTASAKPGYKFVNWTLGGGATSTSNLTNASITIKGDGSSATGTATAIFEEDLSSNWYVRGDSPFCGWTTDANCMLKKETGHSTSSDVYYTVTLSANTNVAFKIWDNTNSGSYYGAFTDGGNYWISSTSGQIQLNPGDDYHNLEIRGTVAGDYLIHFNTSTKKVEVTWPEKYFIAGNANLLGDEHAWKPQEVEMTNRSYTFSNLAANTDYRFRITDGTWDHTWGYTDLATGSDENLATLEDNNVHFTLTTAGDVTISIDTDKKVHVTTTGTFGEYRYTLWKIGGMKSEAWSERVFMKKSGELDQSIAYYEVELTKDDYVFKIKNPSGTYLGNEGEITGNVTNWEFYQYYGDGKTEKPNCRLKATVVGTYIFKLDFSNASAPKVSVTYPRGEGYTATITTEGAGKVQKDGVDVTEVPLYEVYGTALTAVPNDGYHFVGWTTTGGVFIDNNNKSTDSPAYFYATGTGTIKATFAKNPTIYFNNTMSKTWGTDEMYVYFYSTDYWDESEYGSGAKDILAGPFAMTQIPKTNIWEYTYDPTAAPFNRTNIKGVVFSDENMDQYEHFQNCSATYRMDYNNGCANMFVLNPQQDVVLKNTSAKYYKKGFWRNYNSTTSKMYLNIWDCDKNEGIGSYELLTDAAGNEAFSAKVNLSNNKRYNIYVGNCTGSNFSQKVDITSENYTGFDLYEYESIDDKPQLAYLTTKSNGDYVFTLTFDDAHMLFSVEYPIMLDDYRVKIGDPVRYSNIIRSDQESGTISMFLNEGTNTFTYDKVTNVNVNPIVWTADGTINVNVEKAGVYTMTLGRDKHITNVKPYTGNYFVRTDCAQGGWQEYKTNDNNLMRYTERQPDFMNNPAQGFNYYYCRWCANESSNVRFVVANEINACISDTMKADTWLDDTEFLKGAANIRFGWNSNTNELSRAYISGSYNDERYMQIRSNDSKLFEYTQEETVITEKSFVDENDWTYTMDVLANGTAQVAVSAYYNNKYQSFVGEVNQENGEIQTTETLLTAGTKQHLRLVYDFKTDRLISGWMPSGDITTNVILDADMLLVREAQGSAAQIRITETGVEISKINTIYSVLQLNRDKMLSNENGILADGHLHENAIYWISFPFDVAVNDIFGIDGYGTKWVIQYYDGDLRSKIGFFKETETFWTYLGINDTIRANVGYALCLDPDFFDDADDAIWANGRQSVSFYFPSADRNLKIVGNGTKTVLVPQHECTIDRTFADGQKNHKDTDTDWNVIGSPAFQDLTGTSSMCTMHALYQWNSTTNGYNVATVEGFDFKTTHAYLVQFHGEINWQNASVINPTVAPAPRYAYADEKNYTVELMFYFGNQWDRAYVALKDNANKNFVLSEDLTKMINAGQPNIYSYAGAYDVAYNGTTFENQTVNLGVIARKNGTYTFSMPKDFSGTAKLIDLVEGITTDLNISDYSVDLNKGTYNDRFQLLLEVEAKAPTSVEATGDRIQATGKTTKILRNGNIYLINAGRVYNATGTMVR